LESFHDSKVSDGLGFSWFDGEKRIVVKCLKSAEDKQGLR